MSGRLIRGHAAQGRVSLVVRLDLSELDIDQRPDAIGRLADHVDIGSTVEIIVADLDDGAPAVVQHLTELTDGGVDVKLVGTPDALHDWLEAIR